MVDNIFAFLSRYHPLPEDCKTRLGALLKTKTIKKKDFLLQEGRTSNHVYFIEKGLLRVYYLMDGEEMCSGLLCEGGVAISVESFFERTPAYEYMQALEELTVYYLSYDDLESLYKDHLEFNIVGRKLITEYYVQSEKRNRMLRKQTAKDKYEFFQTQLSHLLPRVPRKDIASYLGMTLETLSRLSY